ncbi:hypothetical protein [Candidatus Palauibacter sp.]|uniref:hypothetical protein n=1 Tax=Candidatus Palauibacter sp. TaxID=3101350 RepID=UPI003B0151FD
MKATRSEVLVLLGFLFVPWSLPAQEREETRRAAPEAGLVWTDADGWRAPTMAEALDIVRGRRSDMLGTGHPTDVGVAFIRQIHATRSPGELAAFASELGEIAAADAEFTSPERAAKISAVTTLTAAVSERRTGTSYPPAFHVLTGVFETRVDRILGGGDGDPAYVAAQRSRRTRIQLAVALEDVYRADPRGRGHEYVAEVARSATPPAVECRPRALYIRPPGTPDPDADKPWCPADSLWCDAWGILITHDPRTGRNTGTRREIAVEGAPDLERYGKLCNWKH